MATDEEFAELLSIFLSRSQKSLVTFNVGFQTQLTAVENIVKAYPLNAPATHQNKELLSDDRAVRDVLRGAF